MGVQGLDERGPGERPHQFVRVLPGEGPDGLQELLAAADKDAELMTWFQNQVVGAREKFSKYMRFDKA